MLDAATKNQTASTSQSQAGGVEQSGCDACDGTGSIQVTCGPGEHDRMRCEVCGGTGAAIYSYGVPGSDFTDTCRTCDGTGEALQGNPNSPRSHLGDCPDCGEPTDECPDDIEF